jgi:hypothetical protein
MTSLRQQVFDYHQDNMSATNKEFKIAFHNYNWNSVRTYMNEARGQNYINQGDISNDILPQKKHSKKRVEVRKNKPDTKGSRGVASTPPLNSKFIDDPEELILSVSIRELNKPDPDVRWANLLVNALKSKITIKGDNESLQQQSISTLVRNMNAKLPENVKQDTSRAFESSLKASTSTTRETTGR